MHRFRAQVENRIDFDEFHAVDKIQVQGIGQLARNVAVIGASFLHPLVQDDDVCLLEFATLRRLAAFAGRSDR